MLYDRVKRFYTKIFIHFRRILKVQERSLWACFLILIITAVIFKQRKLHENCTFCFSSEIHFLGKFGTKNQYCQFKLKFGTWSNPNMRNSVVMFTFSVFDWKYPFCANLVQKIKIVNLILNMVPKLIQICRVKKVMCTLSVLDWKHHFWANLAPKNPNFQFKLKFGIQTDSNMQNSMVVFTFSVFDQKYPFQANFVQK